MFVNLDKLSHDREGSDLVAPPPSGQQYRGRGLFQREDQQELSCPVTRSAAATQREAQRYGGWGLFQREDQQELSRPVTRSAAATQREAQRYGGWGLFQREDQQKLRRPVTHSAAATQREAQRYGGRGLFQREDQQELSHPVTRSAAAQRAQRYRGWGPSQHEDQQEPSCLVTRSAAATQREAQRSGGQSKQPGDVVDFNQQVKEFERLRLKKEECDRNKVSQTLSSRAIKHTTPSPLYNRQLNAGSLVQPSLLIGSMVQVSDPPQYGVLRWIGELPDMKGVIAGVEMVSLPL